MKHYFFVFSLIISTFSFAQNNPDNLTQFGRVNLGMHGLELTYELPLSNSFVWENSFGAGMGSYTRGNSSNFQFYFNKPTPFFTSEMKWIYNRNKRNNKGKSLINNAGNYIGLQTKYSFGNATNFKLNKTLLTEIHWGIQRPLGVNFIFDFHIGFGILNDYDFEESYFSPTLGFRFGYKLF